MTKPAFERPLQLPLAADDLAAINDHLRTLEPQQILAWALDHLPGLYQTTAFGLTGLVALDMLAGLAPSDARPPLVFIDTLYHFPETYELLGDVEKRYQTGIHVFKPQDCETRQDFEKKWGEKLWERDEDTYDYNVKACVPYSAAREPLTDVGETRSSQVDVRTECSTSSL